MPTTYLPTADLDLAPWATEFGRTLSASTALYGVSAEEAAHYVTLAAAFAQSVKDCEPATRTMILTAKKRQNRDALLAETRRIVKIVDGQRDVTPVQRFALGVKPRRTPTRRAAPQDRPAIGVEGVEGLSIRLRIVDAPGRSGKPDNVIGVILFCAVSVDGNDVHAVQSLQFAGTYSRNSILFTFDTWLPPGTPVCFAAQWLSRTLKAGPMGPIAKTHVLSGLAKAMPQQQTAA